VRRPGLLVPALLALSCAHGTEPDISTLASSSDEIIWEAGQKAYDKKSWETARQYFRRIVDGFPHSEYGPGARIGLGDSYFKEGGTANYILAVSAYREFLTFYPSHTRSDYVQFQIGESFFKQRNGADRDQTQTVKALEEYGRVVEVYAASPFAEQAKARIDECRQSLARSEFLAGYFYQRTRQACRAAISRYEGILKEFPDYRGTDAVLFRLAECLARTGRGPEAQPHLARLLEQFPGSEHAESARELMSELGRTPPSASPAAAPSPAALATPKPVPTRP
jgi:outer membrane protein assembly factor BamD